MSLHSRTIARAIALALPLLAVAGCATTVQVEARYPATNPAAAELREIAVASFDGPNGGDFATALETELASAQFDNSPYFTLVDSGRRNGAADAKTSAGYGRSIGAKGVFFGHVQGLAFQNQNFTGATTVCVVSNGADCKKWAVQEIACVKRALRLDVLPQLVKVANGQIVYSARKSAVTETSWCSGEVQPDSDYGLYAAARQNILAEIRRDIAPYNAVLHATIKEDNSGLDERLADQFDAAVQSAKKGDMAEACRLWREVSRAAPDHAWTVYDLGVCFETEGSYQQALAQYQRARTLAPKSDSAITDSIDRAQSLVAAHGELAREDRKRKDIAAADARKRTDAQAAEARAAAQAKRQQDVQAAAAKATRDARHAGLVKAFGAKWAEAIEGGDVVVGMSKAAVVAAKGNPSKRETIGDTELWQYGSLQITLSRGKVTYVRH